MPFNSSADATSAFHRRELRVSGLVIGEAIASLRRQSEVYTTTWTTQQQKPRVRPWRILLRESVSSITESGWDATPIEGKWSVRQVVCHLADTEVVYADRMKRVIAEDNPTFFEADPDVFLSALNCLQRSWETELNLIEAVRNHMLPILRGCDSEVFKRVGVHSLDGPMTLRTLLERITRHVPHHVAFIEEKVNAMRG